MFYVAVMSRVVCLLLCVMVLLLYFPGYQVCTNVCSDNLHDLKPLAIFTANL